MLRGQATIQTCWEPLSERRKRTNLCLMYKTVNGEVPDYLYKLLAAQERDTNPYHLRNSENLVIPQTRQTVSYNSFIPSTVRLWNTLDASSKSTTTLNSFKNTISPDKLKPQHMAAILCERKFEIILNRLRNTCSSLNYDLFRVNLINSRECRCSTDSETVEHYFFDCPLFYFRRQHLYRDVANYHPFTIQLLLSDLPTESPVLNNDILSAVSKFLKSSERFS